jgi:hypothetical protein
VNNAGKAAAKRGKQRLPSGRFASCAPSLRAGLNTRWPTAIELSAAYAALATQQQTTEKNSQDTETHKDKSKTPINGLRESNSKTRHSPRRHSTANHKAWSKRPDRQAGRHGRKRPPLRGAKTGTNHARPTSRPPAQPGACARPAADVHDVLTYVKKRFSKKNGLLCSYIPSVASAQARHGLFITSPIPSSQREEKPLIGGSTGFG